MKKILGLLLVLVFISCNKDTVSDITTNDESHHETNDDNSLEEEKEGNDGNVDDRKNDPTDNTGDNQDSNTVENAEESKKVRFTRDLLPIINDKCSGCHTGGSKTNYTEYIFTQFNADLIHDRINRKQGTRGFMPQNGTKLDTTELALFDQWIKHGMLE